MRKYFYLAALILVVILLCVAWSLLDHLSWVKFIMALPVSGWAKMILWGWF